MTGYTKFNPNSPPPPLMTGEPDSFAHWTMTHRIPEVVEKVLSDYADRYPGEIKQTLRNLRQEVIQNGPLRPLETTAPDGPDWTEARQPYRSRSWLDAPWYFAEAFFYRRLVEAAGYFGRYGDRWAGVDPFLPRKQAELHGRSTRQILEAALEIGAPGSAGSFKGLLHYCLWGNRLDLSYGKLADTVGGEIAVDREQANLLVDDTAALLTHLETDFPARRIDFICDNAGTELLMDLALADFLLRLDWAGAIILHLKAHPTFVSDATPADLDLTIATLKTKQAENLVALAGRLAQYRQEKRLLIRADRFWNSHHFFWDIPPSLHRELAQAQLVIFKGDANYRRLLGDSRWPAAVPLGDAVPYFPTSFVALRTMKSDPVVGLKPGQAQKLDEEDPEWRVNGQRGMIQALLK